MWNGFRRSERKLMKLKFTFIALLLLKIGYSQVGDSLSNENYEYEPDKIAKEAVSKIVQYTGLTPNFTVVADNNIKSALAYLKNNQRYISYNPEFIKKLNNKAKTNWAAVSVLAHEIGHHLAGHTLLKEQSPGNELIADRFSGFILHQMGATLEEAMAALSAIGHETDTIRHPPKSARLQAIANGWNDAKNLKNSNAYDNQPVEGKERVKFMYKCTFIGDDNIYFVDEKGNIIWYNNQGSPIIIGKKEESKTGKYLWIYNYLDNYYGVDAKGKIWKESTYGSVYIIGQAVNIP